jgi:septal ring factor EnvC (AmiA/AmiB activator)
MNIDKDNKTITVAQNTGVTVSVALLIMFTGAIITLASSYADFQNRLTQAENKLTGLNTDIIRLKADGTDAKIKLTEIQTQLKSIDTSLLEIKQKLN